MKKTFLKHYKKYMLIVGVAGQSVFYSQFVTILVHKSAQDVSLIGFSTGLIAVLSWLVYGLLIRDKVLILSNCVATLGASLTVGAIFYYR